MISGDVTAFYRIRSVLRTQAANRGSGHNAVTRYHFNNLNNHYNQIQGVNTHITRKGVPELRGPALGCMNAIDKNRLISFVKITVLVFFMSKNPKCPGYN